MAERSERRVVQTMSDDLKNVEFETSEEVEVTPTFDAMGLREDLIRGIYAYGRDLSHLASPSSSVSIVDKLVRPEI